MRSTRVSAMEPEIDPAVDKGYLIPPKTESQYGGGDGVARFDSGNKVIDFVLPYLVEKDCDEYEKRTRKRERFLESLTNDFQLEFEVVIEGESQSVYGAIQQEQEKDSKLHYVKIHAPMETLYHSAEDLKMKMPTNESDIDIKGWYEKNACFRFLKKIDIFRLQHPEVHESAEYFVRTFQKERLTEFVNHDNPEKFFSPAERGRLVFFLLQQARYGDDDVDIGVENLIHDGVFLDAYPLHDGPTLKSNKDASVNARQRLQKDWANFRCLFRYQPIDGIREYFGEKIALYFSWLGFYVAFLIPAAFIGILCFIYGIATSVDSQVVNQTCSDPRGKDGTHLFYMCPLCDSTCAYFLLKSSCMYAKLTHFFDNEATIFFAIFISIWSTLFLEFWKRHQFALAHKWHSLGFEETEERVRPEYIAVNKKLKVNVVTMKQEPYMPKGKKCRRMMGTVSVVAFFLLLILVCVIGVIVFRAAIGAVLHANKNSVVRTRSSIIVSVSAALINLLVINVLKIVYNKCAVVLTDWENPRTRTDYEDSFTIKMFLFQFFNTYSSIIYIAFFKTELITGSPGQYKRFTSAEFRLSGCSAQGCFLELTIQLIIIMVGQQVISNVLEFLLPTVLKWWHDRKAKKKAMADGTLDVPQPQWADDYEGEMQTKFSLFWEYLEIVLQYGFVTMFVAAFPLAPFFALLNNVLEIRVDAYNYVNNCRRPVAKRAEDIGAWYNILSALTQISVLINAFVLAFTSSFIDRAVYRYHDSKNGTLTGYVDWSLSTFNVSDFKAQSRPDNLTKSGIPEQWYCRYPGFHESTLPYSRNLTYWMVLSARLAFVLCFVLFVLFFTWLVSYIVPDVPKSVALRIKREKFLASEADRMHKEKSGMRPARTLKDDTKATTVC